MHSESLEDFGDFENFDEKKTKKIYHFARTNYNIYNVYVYGRIGTHTFIGERPGGAGGAGAPLE